ncbi:MSANTD3 family protein [Megaselia abdita]
MEEKAKKPQPHFSNQERAALLLIVKKYEKYIEEEIGKNKKVNRFNKNRAWLVIKQEFNKAIGSSGTERDVLSLRSKYFDMRKKHVQAMKQKKQFGHDSSRNILQELIDEVNEKEDINDEVISIKNEPLEFLEEEEFNQEETDNKRGANYTNYEKFLLMKLVDKYRNFLLDRGSDSVIRSEKTNTWETIAKEFRGFCPDGQYRTAQKLRDKFSDMKKVHRKTIKFAGNQDREFYLMKKLLENNFEEEELPEPPSYALSKILSETPICIESLPDIRNNDDEEDNDEYLQEDPEEEISSESFPEVKIHESYGTTAQEQYYIDKNRREEEEHRMTMEILKLRAQKETLDIKFRTEEHEMRKDVLCREMEKND